jgi:hypothetical protein
MFNRYSSSVMNYVPHSYIKTELSIGFQLQGRESDHSYPSNAEVKNGGFIPPLPEMPKLYN